MIYEVGDDLCDKAFEEFISRYSSTIFSLLPLNQVKPIDLPMDLLQVKSNITKNIISRELSTGYLKPWEKRNSLHYSHKRIRRPTWK